MLSRQKAEGHLSSSRRKLWHHRTRSISHERQTGVSCTIYSCPRHTRREVRQHLLAHLMGPFGCPRSLIRRGSVVEEPCPFRHSIVPNRRLDIVCFSHLQGSLDPLLIIECKASKPSAGAIPQLNGYNFFLHAPAIALAWPGNIFVSHQGKTLFEGAIPFYRRIDSCRPLPHQPCKISQFSFLEFDFHVWPIGKVRILCTMIESESQSL